MKLEIQHAVQFFVDTLRENFLQQATRAGDDDLENKLCILGTRLTDALTERYQNHWYTNLPLKGSAYRCVNISMEDQTIDVALRRALQGTGFSEDDIFHVFGNGLALWIDPNDVSARIGKGAIFPIYKKITESRSGDEGEGRSSSGIQHRSQQRPRSVSPTHVSAPEFVPASRASVTPPLGDTTGGGLHSRTTSRTPPGFHTLNATAPSFNAQGCRFSCRGLMSSNTDNNNFQETLWGNQAFHESPSNSNTQHMEFQSSENHPSSSYIQTSKYGPDDAVYSFNQYSSYYNSHSHWRRETTPGNNVRKAAERKRHNSPLSAWFQHEDDIYRQWNTGTDNSKQSIGGNHSFFNDMQNNYSHGFGRQAQEVY